MTNATKTLLSVFGVLTLVTALHMAFAGKGTSEAFSSAIVSFDSTAVDRMVIDRADKPDVELKKEDGIWKIRYEDGTLYPADRNAVMLAMGDLLKLKIKTLTTRDPQKFGRFLVDSTGTTVRLFDGEKEKAGLVIGKFNFVSRSEFNTYVRKADGNEVFAIEGFLNSTFNRDADNWRDKTVLKLDEKQIRQVEVILPGDSSWAAFRAGPDAWTSVNDTLDKPKTDALVRQVASISASQFDDSVKPADVPAPLYTVKINLDNATSRELKFAAHPNDGSAYQVTLSDYPYVFRVNRSVWDGAVLKGRNGFLKK